METRWKINARWRDDITPVRLVKETDCFITVLETSWTGREVECRSKKDGSVFESFAAAREALIADAKSRVDSAEAELRRAKERLKRREDIAAPMGGE